MCILKDLKEFYKFIEELRCDVRIDKNKNVWTEKEIIAKFEPKKEKL